MIKTTIDPKSLSYFKRKLEDYKKICGKTEVEVMRQVGKVAAGEACFRTQPWGVDAKVGKKFMGSVRKQIYRSAAHFLGEESLKGRVEEIHRKSRRQGVVPRRRLGTQRRPIFRKFTPNERAEIDSVVEKKLQKVGRMKAAWLAAGQTLSKTTRLRAAGKVAAKWITRHVADARGAGFVGGRFPNVYVVITNNTPYIQNKKHYQHEPTAMMVAINKQIKRMGAEIRAKLKKTI